MFSLLFLACVHQSAPPVPVQTLATATAKQIAEEVVEPVASVQITNKGTWWGSCYIAALYQKPEGVWERYSGSIGEGRLGPGETAVIPVPKDWPIFADNTDESNVCFVIGCESQDDSNNRGYTFTDECYGSLIRGSTIECKYDREGEIVFCDDTGLTVYYP